MRWIRKGGQLSSKDYITSEPLAENIYLNKALKMYTQLTFQAIPSLQSARTQGEEKWIHRERSRKKCRKFQHQKCHKVPERSSKRTLWKYLILEVPYIWD